MSKYNGQWPNFTRDEFACSYSGENLIRDELIDLVQDIRTEVGEPLVITSGYRSPIHPLEVKKEKPGTHARGEAADIAVSHALARKVIAAALAHPMLRGIGIQQKGTGRFIHVDIGLERKDRIWTY